MAELLKGIPEYFRLRRLIAGGGAVLTEKAREAEKRIDGHFEGLSLLSASLGEDLQFTEGGLKSRGRERLAMSGVEERIRFIVYGALLEEADLSRITASADTSLKEDANSYGPSRSLREKLPAAVALYRQENEKFLSLLKSAGSRREGITGEVFHGGAEAALEASAALRRVSSNELDVLLKKRIAFYRTKLAFAASLTLLSVFLAAAFRRASYGLLRLLNSSSELWNGYGKISINNFRSSILRLGRPTCFPSNSVPRTPSPRVFGRVPGKTPPPPKRAEARSAKR